MPTSLPPHITIVCQRASEHPGWVKARIRKSWWSVSDGTRSRGLAETWVYVGEMLESAAIAAVLRESLRAWEDELYRL